MSMNRARWVFIVLALAAAPGPGAAGSEHGQDNQAFNSEEIQAPMGAYSHGVKVPAHSRWLVAAGQAGARPDGTAPAEFEAQAAQALANVRAILRGAGMDWADVVRLNVFLTDRADVAAWSKVRSRILGPARPVGTLLVVKGLAGPQWRIEVEATAAQAGPGF